MNANTICINKDRLPAAWQTRSFVGRLYCLPSVKHHQESGWIVPLPVELFGFHEWAATFPINNHGECLAYIAFNYYQDFHALFSAINLKYITVKDK